MDRPSPPLIVLVHGAWHGAWCWARLQAELDSRGIASLAPDLPGHGTSVQPLGDLHGDAAHVVRVLERVDGPALLVGHSYGGAVITQAAAQCADVVHLVYLAAFVPDEGEAVRAMAASMPPATSVLTRAIVIGQGASTIDPTLAAEAFYGHCDPAVATANTLRLGAQTLASFDQPVSAAAWKTIPSTYVRCTDDNAIPPSHQLLMAARCGAIETLATDHSPMGSMPVQTADIISRIVDESKQ